MPTRKVEPEQVVKMSVYLTNEKIAERLNISSRQVSRILSKWSRPKNRFEDRRTNDPEVEALYMKALRNIGLSFSTIGYHFGLSRQAVHERLKNS